MPALLLILTMYPCGLAQVQPPPPAPDPRYKADILLIVAHPDDDTAISTYLSKAVLDEGKRVAVLFTTRGSAGPNAVGMEQGRALSDVREMEARRSLAARGITNVWFLPGGDIATQDVLHSLEGMGHGAALEEVVRIVRLTRPEVILTWLPAYVAGENHGDHQASSVLSVEAFDCSGDPTAFPEQISAPRAHWGINNYGEGLHPWQPRKLYFFSDASHPEFLKGHGPVYLANGISHSKKVPFSEINRLAWEQYSTQIDFGAEELAHYINMPEYLVLGKSLVPSAMDADVWAGINDDTSAFQAPVPYKELPTRQITLQLGGPWAFYRNFYRVHRLASLEELVPPQTALSDEHQLWVPLLLRNGLKEAVEIEIHPEFPQGWTGDTKDHTYHLDANETYPISVFLTAPSHVDAPSPQTLKWKTTRSDKTEAYTALSVWLEYNGVPQ